MKRKSIVIVCIVMMGMNLAACAKTPEKSAVVDKSQGLSEEFILPEEKETPKDLKIPARWQETLERSDGFVTVKADCEMEIPEIYNSPVYSYEMQPMTEELLKKLCDYFSEGDRLYEYPKMTRSELEAEKEDMVNHRGYWTIAKDAEIGGMVKRLDELISQAPEEISYTYVEPKLAAPYQTDKEYIYEAGPFVSLRFSDYYFQSEEEIGMKLRIDKGQTADPSIYVMDYRENVGSTTRFQYSQGTYVDEAWLEKGMTNYELLDLSDKYGAYLKGLKSEFEKIPEVSFSQEEALQEAEKVLEDLGLEDYAMTECYQALVNPEEESWAFREDLLMSKDRGYSMHFLAKSGDLKGYDQPFQKPFTNLPETIYAPAFSTERIHMVVTEDGVQTFEWTNISRKKGVIAENTKLLTLEEIKEKLADHLLYISMVGDHKEDKRDGYTFEYTVENAELRAANIPAFEDLTATWLTPVWVFRVKERWMTPKNGTYSLTDKEVVLNAIDGGYVQPRIDPRVPIPE